MLQAITSLVTCNVRTMGKNTERIRKWRERRKAEGMKSFTVVLSAEAQRILVSEKSKTGSSYSVIIEKALQNLSKPAYKPSTARRLSATAEVFEKKVPVSYERSGKYVNKIPILIDDFANQTVSDEVNYPNGLNTDEGFISRILRVSRSKLSRRKKWFR